MENNIWNSLPTPLWQLANFFGSPTDHIPFDSSPVTIPPNLATFKNLLKTHLFDHLICSFFPEPLFVCGPRPPRFYGAGHQQI